MGLNFPEKHAHYICGASVLLPVAFLGVASFWELGIRWLEDNHPMRALMAVFIVLAIAWASQTVETRTVETVFWARCLLPLFLIFLAIGCIEILGFEEWINRAREPLLLAILAAAPIILLASRLQLRLRGPESLHEEKESKGSATL